MLAGMLSSLASALLCLPIAQSPAGEVTECHAFATVASLPIDIEEYRGTPYYFLNNGRLSFTVDTAPADDLELDLLWGAKDDTRTARLTINGHSQTIRAGGHDGFRWVRVTPEFPIEGDSYQVTLEAAGGKAAFLAAVRLVDEAVAVDAPFELPTEPHHITFILPEVVDGWPVVESFADLPPLERNGLQARRALACSDRFTRAWLARVDPESGLIPENLDRGLDRWNGRNNAADNYAFMVLTAALTDRPLFEGQLLDMLRTEQRLTSRIDRLGDSYKFSTAAFEYAEANLDRIIFDNSEYVKDGLMPLTEWLGHSPWSERMSGIIDDIWKHAPIETAGGRIPSTNIEVNGEMMQLTSRYFWLTGERKYLDHAIRIADYYLLGDRHPTRDSASLKLRDHGCELISGLTEVYFACSHADEEKAEEYRKPLHELLDCILRCGTDENGMMFNAFNPQTGEITSRGFSDNWGYNYNAFYTIYLVDGTTRYRDAVRLVLGKLDHYESYAWERRSHDGYADSIESAINLFNREPIDVAADWIDSQMRIMLAMQREDGIIGGWHGDGNFARTAIMYALWKQQGVTIQPWREDVRLGAEISDGVLELQVAADEPWKGHLIFDAPRHRTVMRMPQDYPRINQFPEWFTVDTATSYEVNLVPGEGGVYRGEQLLEGLPVELTSPDRSVRVEVR
jgi:hypothetical protein